MNYPIELTELAKDSQGQPLICSGWAHSASGAPFPGHPSGERPCSFCIRNVQREEWSKEHFKQCNGTQNIGGEIVNCVHPAHGVWYNGTKAFKSPMDCYVSVDRSRQE